MLSSSLPGNISIQPWHGSLGATLEGIDLTCALEDELMGFVQDMFLKYQVIALPGQVLTTGQFAEFAYSFGDPYIYPFAEPIKGFPGVMRIAKEADTELNFGGVWHIDTPYLEYPPIATFAYAIDIPVPLGDTLFSNLYAAYEDLSADLKQSLRHVRGDYVSAAVMNGGVDVKLSDLVRVYDAPAAKVQSFHPLFRTHPLTGRKALFVSRCHMQGIEGMNHEEAGRLLDQLAEHACSEQFTSRLSWSNGLVVVWDNRCVQHKAMNDYKGHRREIHRTMVCDHQKPS